MNYYSTENHNYSVSLQQAVMQSLAPDKGLYMPRQVIALDSNFWSEWYEWSFQGIAFRIAKAMTFGEIPEETLSNIINDAIDFPAPVVPLTDQIGSLELWHGPSLAFKDFGARFMSRLMSYYAQKDEKLTVLVATSGDTGGAVAYGFLGVPNIEVIILYPSGKVSHLQEKQLTTLGQNISAVEVDGTFDDCQHFVKQAFLDKDLSKEYKLSSANSINIARLIPQIFYYFEAYRQVIKKGEDTPFYAAIPSGNFGNLTAGILAKRLGLPIARLIAATNVNHVVPDYLSDGIFRPMASTPTISNAMDVGNPSNFTRMLDLYGQDHSAMTKDIVGYWYDDVTTKDEMLKIKETYGYISEPHGAIGHRALSEYIENIGGVGKGVFFETAHPAKFIDVVEPVIGKVEIPERLGILANRAKLSTLIKADYNAFKSYLLDRL